MAFQFMEKVSGPDDKKNVWEKVITLNAAGNSSWVFPPFDSEKLIYTLSFDDDAGGGAGSGSATGKIQITNDLRLNIINDNEIITDDWPYGTIINQQTFIDGTPRITAFRVVMVGGTGRVRLAVSAQD